MRGPKRRRLVSRPADLVNPSHLEASRGRKMEPGFFIRLSSKHD
jgi:hypothetical protein